MPNTPSLVGIGASGLYANAAVSDAQRTLATQLMEAVGIVEWVEEERLLDAVTAVSGSAQAWTDRGTTPATSRTALLPLS